MGWDVGDRGEAETTPRVSVITSSGMGSVMSCTIVYKRETRDHVELRSSHFDEDRQTRHASQVRVKPFLLLPAYRSEILLGWSLLVKDCRERLISTPGFQRLE
jgi:hypothetical protein